MRSSEEISADAEGVAPLHHRNGVLQGVVVGNAPPGKVGGNTQVGDVGSRQTGDGVLRQVLPRGLVVSTGNTRSIRL